MISVWYDNDVLQVLIKDIPYGEGKDHAKRITPFSRDEGKTSSILVVYDSASENRQRKPVTLVADISF
jgi:hypothetical protein